MKFSLDLHYIIKLLGEEELRIYWKKNRNIIMDQTKDYTGLFHTVNYSIDYQEELPKLFAELDEFSVNAAQQLIVPDPAIDPQNG
jgi:hypothetical protein